MKFINIIVEGNTEENFVNNILVNHFATMNKFVAARKITTGWSKSKSKYVKGGLLKFNHLKKDIENWIYSDKGKENTWYTTLVDLYAFPKDESSPYTLSIQNIADHYTRISELEKAIANTINYRYFIPYVQLHEFEAFLLVDPDKLIGLYPEANNGIKQLKENIGDQNPEEINESPQTSPSKRIIRYLPSYENEKAQAGPLIAADIGLSQLRNKCRHFNDWITQLENV